MPFCCNTPGCGGKAVFSSNGKLWCARCYCREHGIKLSAEQPPKEAAKRTK